MPKFDDYNDMVDPSLMSEQPSYLTKFTLDLNTGQATEKRILDLVVERPTYNTDVLPRTIAYLRSEGESSRELGAEIVKYDLKNEKILGRFKCKDECTFVEAQYVPSSSEKAESDEDAGYLMDLVYNSKTNSSSFIVIDAKTMNPNPIFMASLPQRVPFGVHGLWLDKQYFDN